MKKAVIIIWLGPLPVNFRLWLRSVGYNPDFDFLFFTNQSFDDFTLPPNFKPIPCSLETLRSLIITKLGIEPIIKRAYKFCDFRPAFGILFEDYLKEYDFWGHCDVDLMFGRLSHFIQPNVLQENYKIYIRGHFSLYRNIDDVNLLYTRSPRCDYQKIFASGDNFIFDEWAGIGQIFKEFGISFYHKEELADISPGDMLFRAMNIRNYDKQLFVWEEGKIFQYYLEKGVFCKIELSYVHFQKRIMPLKDTRVLSSEKVLITNNGFYAHEGIITPDMLAHFDRINISHGINRVLKGAKKRFSEVFSGVPVVNRSLCDD